MKTIRSSIFETNSSSVHAIVVSKSGKLDNIPKEDPILELFTADFGWEVDSYYDFYSKLCYLLNGCDRKGNEVYREKIEVFLSDLLGVESIDYTPGYIDHNNITDLLEYVTCDFNNLKQFLCSRNSFIQTGNDNSEETEYGVNEVISKYSNKPDYEVFIKGN